MEIVDATQINSFASMAQQANVQPSEEPVFILTSNQLEDIVKQAVQNALESPKDLGQIVLDQAREIGALNAKLEAMQKDMDSLADNQLIQLRLINDLRKDKEPQPLQKDRGEILRALIAANGGKMLAKEARQKMRMDKATFSRLLGILQDYIDIKPFHQDKRRLVLMLKIG